MGLIRKTLMISTAGVVRGSSKKQRVAKKSLHALQAQNREMGIRTPSEEMVAGIAVMIRKRRERRQSEENNTEFFG